MIKLPSAEFSRVVRWVILSTAFLSHFFACFLLIYCCFCHKFFLSSLSFIRIQLWTRCQSAFRIQNWQKVSYRINFLVGTVLWQKLQLGWCRCPDPWPHSESGSGRHQNLQLCIFLKTIMLIFMSFRDLSQFGESVVISCTKVPRVWIICWWCHTIPTYIPY